MSAGLTSAALGIVIAVGILWLVRRDRMHGGYALWWLLVAVGALGVGFFPGVVDWFGLRLGVQYPPMLLALGAIAAVVLKLAAADIDATLRERRLRRLLQKVAILELELKTLRAEFEQSRRSPANDVAPLHADVVAAPATPRRAKV
jgi:hypothetical protein